MFCSIQFLRAAAALAVVVFHVTQRAHAGVIVGAAGVDVFFVVSGFVMWVSTAGRPARPGAFLLHRAIRIIPAYWAATALTAAMSTRPITWPHAVASLLFLPHANPDGGQYPLLAVGWTLELEVLFYLLFAMALLRRHGRIATVTLPLAVLAGIGWVAAPAGSLARAYTDPIVLEFAAGMALAAATRRHPLGRVAGAVALAAGIAAFGLQAVIGSAAAPWRLLAWGLPAALTVAGAVALEPRSAIPGRLQRAGLRLGGASYAIYLLHGLVIGAWWRLWPGAPLWAGVAGCVLLSAGVGVVVSTAVEQPVTQWLRDRLPPVTASRGRPTVVPGK